MKKDIHPKVFEDSNAKCACGATFSIPSTKASLDVEICSSCHPLYTRTEKILDSAGRVKKKKKKRAAAKK